MITLENIKERLGGWQPLAFHTGVKYRTAEQWKRNGIPSSALIKLYLKDKITKQELAELAREK